MRTMTRTRPSPPVGAYPQLLLCGQLGSAPISAKIKITINIVPIISDSFSVAAYLDRTQPASTGSSPRGGPEPNYEENRLFSKAPPNLLAGVSFFPLGMRRALSTCLSLRARRRFLAGGWLRACCGLRAKHALLRLGPWRGLLTVLRLRANRR